MRPIEKEKTRLTRLAAVTIAAFFSTITAEKTGDPFHEKRRGRRRHAGNRYRGTHAVRKQRGLRC